MSTSKLILLSLSAITSLSLHLHGALIAQDDFLLSDYTGVSNPSTGSPASSYLQGQGGGTGFVGNWDGRGNEYIVDDSGLSVTGRPSGGG